LRSAIAFVALQALIVLFLSLANGRGLKSTLLVAADAGFAILLLFLVSLLLLHVPILTILRRFGLLTPLTGLSTGAILGIGSVVLYYLWFRVPREDPALLDALRLWGPSDWLGILGFLAAGGLFGWTSAPPPRGKEGQDNGVFNSTAAARRQA
jgi:hypothetical protein